MSVGTILFYFFPLLSQLYLLYKYKPRIPQIGFFFSFFFLEWFLGFLFFSLSVFFKLDMLSV